LRREEQAGPIEVRRRLFRRSEVYVGGRRLSGEFLYDIQTLAQNHTPRELISLLLAARERYEEGSIFKELYTKILFATLLKLGAARSRLENGRRVVDVRREVIEELGRFVGESEETIRGWERAFGDWIRNVYVVGDFYPGYGWSSLTFLIDQYTFTPQRYE